MEDDEFDPFDVVPEKKPKVEREVAGGPIDTGSQVGNFIKYNNTIPIVLGILFLTTTGALAASPEVRDSIYSSSQSVKSIDNSYLLTVDVANYPFSAQITGVKEDTDTYIVSYTLHTIDVVNSVWKQVDKPVTMTVAKADLKGEDLGSYVSKQLIDVRDYERYRFTVAQETEKKKGLSQKVVATEYSGLVGKFLGSHDEALPGYAHVDGPAPAPFVPGDPNHLSNPQQLPTYDANNPASQTASAGNATGPSGAPGSVSDSSDTEPPTLQLLGDSAVTLQVGNTYNDLGVAISDNRSPVPAVHTYLDGKAVSSATIVGSSEGSHTIVYQAQDAAGNHSQVSRTVTFVPVAAPAPVTAPAPADPTPAPTDTPAPAP